MNAASPIASLDRRSTLPPWALGLVLIVATIFAYRPAWHAGFIWDDDAYVTNNPLLSAPDGLQRIWFSTDSPSQYFPLVYTTLRAEHALWGLNSAGYHWVNILLHAVNALLVWRLLRRLEIPGAWFAAAIFALHPVNVESVAWITELKNVQSLFFILLALFAWLKFLDEEKRGWWYTLSLLFYQFALFSKTTACTLPAALLLILWLKHRTIDWRRIIQVIPFLALGIAMGLVTMWWERFHQGTEGKIFGLGAIDRLLIASRAVWFYLGKLLWPVDLTFNYPLWKINAASAVAYLGLAAAATTAVAIFFFRRRSGRGLEVAAVYYVATLSPVLGFIMLYTFHFSFVADHYQYVATLGPIALAAAGVSTLSWWTHKSPWLRPAACVAVLFTLSVLTWRQCGMYANLETLWRTTIARNPESFMGHNNLGSVLSETGRMDEAFTHFQRALEIHPDYAEVHYNFGNALLQLGNAEGAMARYTRAIELKPDYANAHYNLGNVLLNSGHPVEAVAHFEQALALRPNNVDAHNNAGIALLRQDRLDEALPHFESVLKLQPDSVQAHNNLGFIFVRKGNLRASIAHYESTLKLQSDNPRALGTLAWILATSPEPATRNGKQAIDLAQRLNELSRGTDPMVLRTLAAALAAGGRYEEAVAVGRRAQQLASAGGNRELAEMLESQIEAHAARVSFHDLSLTEGANRTTVANTSR